MHSTGLEKLWLPLFSLFTIGALFSSTGPSMSSEAPGLDSAAADRALLYPHTTGSNCTPHILVLLTGRPACLRCLLGLCVHVLAVALLSVLS